MLVGVETRPVILCSFSAGSRRVSAIDISVIIIMIKNKILFYTMAMAMMMIMTMMTVITMMTVEMVMMTATTLIILIVSFLLSSPWTIGASGRT